MATVPGTAGYGAEADGLAAAYQALDFAEVHAGVLRRLPPAPARVLDIGAGTGRDAAALVDRGYAVTAVEPTPELRAIGQDLHASRPITWIDDHLPALQAVRQGGQRFDLLLLSGVWMHLDPAERHAGMAVLPILLAAGGRMVLTLRHGPVPPGRRMFEVTGQETVALAAQHGLRCLHHGQRPGMFGRPGVRWTELVLAR